MAVGCLHCHATSPTSLYVLVYQLPTKTYWNLIAVTLVYQVI